MRDEKNVMRVAVGVLLVVLLAAAWQVNTERRTSDVLRSQVEESVSRLNDRNRREQFEFREKCAGQAEKVFRALGYKFEADTLQSHYDPTKGHCFMAIATFPKSNSDGTVTTFKFLLDAYEQKSLATYGWSSRLDKAYSEVPPFMCKLLRSPGQEANCQSDEEYERFVAMYMES